MTSKAKVNKMSEEDEEKVAMWIRESKGRSSLLQDEKMAERYPMAYSSFGNGQQESSTKEQSKEDETMTSIDSSAMTPPSIVTEHAPIEPARQDCRKETTGEESVVETGPESSDPVPSSETPEASIMPTEAISLTDRNVDKQPPIHRVSSRQRRLSLEEYRSIYLPVPKIENRMPVFISARLRDELDKIARRLGGKRMSASGIVENMVKQHLTVYGDELKEWYKL